MNTKMIRPFATFALLGLTTGCLDSTSSDNVKARIVYQSYSVDYSETDNSLVAEAVFRVQDQWGTSLDLQSPSQIALNGAGIQREKFGDTYYRWKGTRSDLGQAFNWQWTDPDGKKYNNTQKMGLLTVLSAPAQISRSHEIAVSIDPALGSIPKDEITLDFEQLPQQFQGTSTLASNGIKDGKVTFIIPTPATPDRALPAGNFAYHLVRRTWKRLDAGTSAGGGLDTTYTTKTYSVQISD